MLHRRAARLALGVVVCPFILLAAPAARGQTQVKPRLHVIVDTSSSMLWTPQQTTTWTQGVPTHGDGSNENPGCDVNGDGLFNDSKIYQAKNALSHVVSSYGEVEWALERFNQAEGGQTCSPDQEIKCTTNADCPTANYYCFNGYCRRNCATNGWADCAAVGMPICGNAGATYRCVQCITDENCEQPLKCDTTATDGRMYTCRQPCTVNADCPSNRCVADGTSHWCDTCQVNGDCATGYSCSNGQCRRACTTDANCADASLENHARCNGGFCVADQGSTSWACVRKTGSYQLMNCPSVCGGEDYTECTSAFTCAAAGCGATAARTDCTNAAEDTTCDSDASPLSGTIRCGQPSDSSVSAQSCVYYSGYDSAVSCTYDPCQAGNECGSGTCCCYTTTGGYGPTCVTGATTCPAGTLGYGECTCTGDAQCTSPQQCIYDPAAAAGAGPTHASRCRYWGSGKLLVQFPTAASDNLNQILSWIDNHETDFAGGTDKELRANGATPLDGALRTARDYFMTQLLPTDAQRACRSQSIILLTDGHETCGGNPAYRAADLFSNIYCTGASCCCQADPNVPGLNSHPGCTTTCTGTHVPVKVYVVGFAVCPSSNPNCTLKTELTTIATAGGTTPYFVTDQTLLEAALADIIASSIPVEKCNGLDDNCNGLTDEDWPNKGQPCAAGLGVCRQTGTYVCNAAQTDVVCSATAGSPGTEICDNLDNNCNGLTDEGALWADKGTACSVGVGACQRQGAKICNPTTPSGATCCGDWTTGLCLTAGTPGTETCNGIDDDCDGQTDESDPKAGTACQAIPGNPGSPPPGKSWVCRSGTWACHSPNLTCDGEIGPATEVCDGIDNNCNGLTDESWPEKGLACSVGVGLCQRTGVYICNPADPTRTCCGDSTSSTCLTAGTPQTEVCDGVDNNCNGQVDESDPKGLGSACTTIPGNTGLGVCKKGVWICQQNAGGGAALVCFGEVGPGPERCNGLDNNCDGVIDSNDPQVGQPCGHAAVGPCRPGALVCQNGALTCQGAVDPSAEKCDGIDNDCDGLTDEDFPLKGTPCDNGQVGTCQKAGVFVCNAAGTGVVCSAAAGTPGAEVCNGLDDNCNGLTDEHPTADEGGPCFTARDGTPFAGGCDTGTGVCLGVCRLGAAVCESPTLVCEGAVGPSAEKCNGLDDDCDGQTDEDFVALGLGSPCDNGQSGICHATGTWVCNHAGDGVVCDAPPGVPRQEICDGVDNDCNGLTDDGLTQAGTTCSNAVGECRPGTWTCTGAGGWACQGGTLPQPEICDGKDNNCNGVIDDNPTDAGGPCYAPHSGAAYPRGCDVTTGVCVGTCQLGHTVCETAALVCDGAVGPVTELCNGLDDDCDGLTDNNATCAQPGCVCYKAECRCPCSASEFPCQAGTTCFDLSGGGAGVPCAHPGDPNCFCIPSKCAGRVCPGGQQCDEVTGSCVDPCTGVTCQAWEVCQSGQCYDCNTFGCPEGQRCVGNQCQVDACAGVTCPDGEFCANDGTCRVACDPGACGDCQKCGPSGTCDSDPCCGKGCPAGEFCDPQRDAACRPDPCVTLQCPAGFVCDKGSGTCAADPCSTIRCNYCQVCKVDVTYDPPLGLCAQSPDPACVTAPAVSVSAQGGGCRAGARTPAWPWVGVLLAGLAPWRRRRRAADGGRP